MLLTGTLPISRETYHVRLWIDHKGANMTEQARDENHFYKVTVNFFTLLTGTLRISRETYQTYIWFCRWIRGRSPRIISVITSHSIQRFEILTISVQWFWTTEHKCGDFSPVWNCSNSKMDTIPSEIYAQSTFIKPLKISRKKIQNLTKILVYWSYFLPGRNFKIAVWSN